MGGAAGHIDHLWENRELSFDDLRIIFRRLYANTLKCEEKIDGQNIQMSIKNGTVICARSSKHLRSYGRDAITIDKIKDYFGENTPDVIRDVYHEAMSLLEEQKTPALEAFFENGKVWINAELVTTQTANVIQYGVNDVVVHNYFRVDERGNKTGDVKEAIKLFLFKYTNQIEFENVINSHIVHSIFSQLEEIKDKMGLKWSSTLSDYIKEAYRIDLKISYPILTDELIENFSYRWATGDKRVRINQLLKGQDEVTKLILKEEDKKSGGKIKDYLMPIIQWCMRAGIFGLKHVKSTTILAEDYILALDQTRNLARKHALEIYNFFENKENRQKHIKLFENYQLFKQTGGTEAMLPLEGIVFEYKGHTYKIQGIFHAALQVIGAVKYGSLT